MTTYNLTISDHDLTASQVTGLRECAIQGDGDAMDLLANHYLRQQSGEGDDNAFHWYRRAAEFGHLDAIKAVALIDSGKGPYDF